MPVQYSTTGKPKPGSLIVCAGTVTCEQVSSMGSGFLFFKNFFKQDRSWENPLQKLLDQYHKQNQSIPPYVNIVTNMGGYAGGVATVPSLRASAGLTHTQYSSVEEKNKAFQAEYSLAVEQAILDAKNLNKPLYIQPLGIGVYGWDPEIAATLFAQAISKYDSKNLDITIAIFDQKLGSKDIQFQNALTKKMSRATQPKQYKTESTSSAQAANTASADLIRMAGSLKGNGWKNVRTALLVLAGAILLAAGILAATSTGGIGLIATMGGGALLTAGLGFFAGRSTGLGGSAAIENIDDARSVEP